MFGRPSKVCFVREKKSQHRATLVLGFCGISRTSISIKGLRWWVLDWLYIIVMVWWSAFFPVFCFDVADFYVRIFFRAWYIKNKPIFLFNKKKICREHDIISRAHGILFLWQDMFFFLKKITCVLNIPPVFFGLTCTLFIYWCRSVTMLILLFWLGFFSLISLVILSDKTEYLHAKLFGMQLITN